METQEFERSSTEGAISSDAGLHVMYLSESVDPDCACQHETNHETKSCRGMTAHLQASIHMSNLLYTAQSTLR